MGEGLMNGTVTDLNGRPLPGEMWGGRGLKNKETVTNLNDRPLPSNCGKGEGAEIKGQ